jgi:hypothetical protein
MGARDFPLTPQTPVSDYSPRVPNFRPSPSFENTIATVPRAPSPEPSKPIHATDYIFPILQILADLPTSILRHRGNALSEVVKAVAGLLPPGQEQSVLWNVAISQALVWIQHKKNLCQEKMHDGLTFTFNFFSDRKKEIQKAARTSIEGFFAPPSAKGSLMTRLGLALKNTLQPRLMQFMRATSHRCRKIYRATRSAVVSAVVHAKHAVERAVEWGKEKIQSLKEMALALLHKMDDDDDDDDHGDEAEEGLAFVPVRVTSIVRHTRASYADLLSYPPLRPKLRPASEQAFITPAPLHMVRRTESVLGRFRDASGPVAQRNASSSFIPFFRKGPSRPSESVPSRRAAWPDEDLAYG